MQSPKAALRQNQRFFEFSPFSLILFCLHLKVSISCKDPSRYVLFSLLSSAKVFINRRNPIALYEAMDLRLSRKK